MRSRAIGHCNKNPKFEKALKSLEQYVKGMEKMLRQGQAGRAQQLTADMLVDWAGILIDEIAAEIGTP